MNSAAKSLGLFLILAIPAGALGANNEALYPDYYAARRALDAGDCGAAREHLAAYLEKHPYIRERYPDHYMDIRFVMQSCGNRTTIRGVGDESEDYAPLGEPPSAEGEVAPAEGEKP